MKDRVSAPVATSAVDPAHNEYFTHRDWHWNSSAWVQIETLCPVMRHSTTRGSVGSNFSNAAGQLPPSRGRSRSYRIVATNSLWLGLGFASQWAIIGKIGMLSPWNGGGGGSGGGNTRKLNIECWILDRMTLNPPSNDNSSWNSSHMVKWLGTVISERNFMEWPTMRVTIAEQQSSRYVLWDLKRRPIISILTCEGRKTLVDLYLSRNFDRKKRFQQFVGECFVIDITFTGQGKLINCRHRASNSEPL